MITALIDGDWILYAAGFAGQRTELVCPSLFKDRPFKNITEIRAAAGDSKLSPKLIYSRDILDPESHFYHSAKSMIETQLKKVYDKFGQDVKPHVMIDGDGNFRSRLATIRPYKGTRSAHAKPLFYNNIRQYLLDAWDAEVIYDQEADDAMAITATDMARDKKRCIIVGVDKDMLQVPGWHLNPKKGFMKISEDEARYRLYVQAAMGDTVDNIAGAYKVGPAAAKAHFAVEQTENQMWETLVHIYQKTIDKAGDDKLLYAGLDARRAAVENMRLVYLRRKPNEMWQAPDTGRRNEDG